MSDFFSGVRNSSDAEIRSFIETNLGYDLNLLNVDGASTLHIASIYAGNAKVVKVLVSMGADVNIKASIGATPLHAAKDAEIARTLISLGADLNAQFNNGRTPLHMAVDNDIAEVVDVLAAMGADMNLRADELKLTPLEMAVGYGRVECVKALLAHGANLNPKDRPDLATPLHIAAVSKTDKNVEIAKLLIAKGADVGAKNANGATSFDLAVNVKNFPMIFCLLNHEPIETIVDFFKNLTPDVNKNDGGWTMLHRMVQDEYVNIVKALVSIGASIDIREQNGLSPLDMAVGGGKVEIVEVLLPYVSDINFRNPNKYTLLHWAAVSKDMAGDNSIAVAKLLISKGADVNAISAKGTALDMAKAAGDTAMVNYLSGITAERAKIEIDKIVANHADALSKNPNDAKVYEMRGFEFLTKGFYDLAIADYTRSIQLNPNNAEAYVNRGMSYSQAEKYDKAIEDFNQVIKLTPDDPSAYGFRGMTYAQMKEFEKAISDLSEAINLKSNYYIHFMCRGMAYRDLHKNEEAKQDLEKVLGMNPDSENLFLANNILNEIKKEEQERLEEEERKRRIAEEQERDRIKAEKRKKRNKILIIAAFAALAILVGLILYNSQQNSIAIPNGVTTINKGEFSRKQLVNVEIPDSVTSIGDMAFRKNKLATIIIPESVTSIGEGAFAGNKLTSISIGSNVTLGTDAFDAPGFETFYNRNGSSAGTYIRPDTKSYDWRVWYNNFEYKYNDGNIVIIGYNGTVAELGIPEEISGYPVKTIERNAFYEKKFTSVVIPNSVTTIGEFSFFGAWDRAKNMPMGTISSIVIGESVTSIGTRAFENNSLSSIILPNSVTSIGVSAFSDNPVTSIRLGANVTLGDAGNNGILGEGTGFNTAYANNGRRAGTYSRPNANSTTWTRR
jgi:ankyrin repeat protein/regulator of sirC expression with transglutaminase-like and TPR domain